MNFEQAFFDELEKLAGVKRLTRIMNSVAKSTDPLSMTSGLAAAHDVANKKLIRRVERLPNRKFFATMGASDRGHNSNLSTPTPANKAFREYYNHGKASRMLQNRQTDFLKGQ